MRAWHASLLPCASDWAVLQKGQLCLHVTPGSQRGELSQAHLTRGVHDFELILTDMMQCFRQNYAGLDFSCPLSYCLVQSHEATRGFPADGDLMSTRGLIYSDACAVLLPDANHFDVGEVFAFDLGVHFMNSWQIAAASDVISCGSQPVCLETGN